MRNVHDEDDTTTRTRAAAYVRVSTKGQVEEGYSLDEQQRRVGHYIADQDGWVHVATFIEPGVSGRRDDRKELTALLDRLDEFDVLVIPALSRLGRSARHLHETFDRLDSAGVELVSLSEQIDTRTATGRFVRSMFAAMAQFEADLTAERVAGSSLPARIEGKAPGGRFTPYGYRRGEEAGQLLVHPPAAAIVERIYRETLAGRSQRDVLRSLNADGIASPTGKRWGTKTIGRILRSPIYYGAITHKGEVVAEDAHEAIIGRELWQQVAELRAARDNAPGAGRGRRPKRDQLFTAGMLRCGRCGSAMSPRSRKSRPVYICTGRDANGTDYCSQLPVPASGIDDHARWFFERVGLDLEATRAEFEARCSLRVAEARALSDQADREVHRLNDEVERITRDYRGGELPASEYQPLIATIRDELTGAEAEAERLRTRLGEVAADAKLADQEEEFLRALQRVREVVAGEVEDADTIDALRAALLRLFDRFTYFEHPADGEVLHEDTFGLWPHFREEMVEGMTPKVAGELPDPMPSVIRRIAIELPETLRRTV